jgi:hypothetical protein
MSDDRTVRALQVALAAEHAVVWGYGLVGGKVGDAVRDAVRQAELAHRARRDATVAAVRTRGGQPVAAEPSYEVPFPVTDEASALRLAVTLEDGAAQAWHYLLGSTTDAALRRTAVAALSDCAVRATRWRVRTSPADPSVAFPGEKR